MDGIWGEGLFIPGLTLFFANCLVLYRIWCVCVCGSHSLALFFLLIFSSLAHIAQDSHQLGAEYLRQYRLRYFFFFFFLLTF